MEQFLQKGLTANCNFLIKIEYKNKYYRNYTLANLWNGTV